MIYVKDLIQSYTRFSNAVYIECGDRLINLAIFYADIELHTNDSFIAFKLQECEIKKIYINDNDLICSIEYTEETRNLFTDYIKLSLGL